jgi:hypothetical protein
MNNFNHGDPVDDGIRAMLLLLGYIATFIAGGVAVYLATGCGK